MVTVASDVSRSNVMISSTLQSDVFKVQRSALCIKLLFDAPRHSRTMYTSSNIDSKTPRFIIQVNSLNISNSYRLVQSAMWDIFFELFLFSNIAWARSAKYLILYTVTPIMWFFTHNWFTQKSFIKQDTFLHWFALRRNASDTSSSNILWKVLLIVRRLSRSVWRYMLSCP